MSHILGLNLGTNSIGWALLEQDANGDPCKILDCGCRIFQEAVEAKTRTSKNHSRMLARSARRLTKRRKQRREDLLDILIEYNLLPEDSTERYKILNNNQDYDPYFLRNKALHEQLSIDEIGRVIFHLNKRRGFKSNRNAQFANLNNIPEIAQLIADEDKTSNDDKETSEMKAAITKLHTDIRAANGKTLGAYLHSQGKKRNHHIERSMISDEFELIWKMQQKYYPNVLTSDKKAEIASIIFYQRPLKVQRSLVGNCTLEPNRKRCMKARLEFQEFRLLQNVNHLKLLDPITKESKKLTDSQREQVITKLNSHKDVKFNALRKLLGLHDNEKFNLESEERQSLEGNRTLYDLQHILGKERWQQLSETEKFKLCEDLFSICRKDTLCRRLIQHWKLPSDIAYKLAINDFEPGYSDLSLYVINKLLIKLRGKSRGYRYDEALKDCGYESSSLTIKISDKLGEPPETRNPVVNKALHETKKLINKIIVQYGIPQKIVVEMARDLRLNKKKLDEINRQQNINQIQNEKAAEELLSHGVFQNKNSISRDDILKYRLWEEVKRTCPYSGEYITLERLYRDIDIDHIIPYSRCLDDSYMNKTICTRKANLEKGQRTPYEAYYIDENEDNQIYEDIKGRIKHFPRAKLQKFYQKTVDFDTHTARHLNDTRYISRTVFDYVKQLGCQVTVTKGGLTGLLRHKFGLNTILNESDIKNRADHRHHTIDSIVIALTTQNMLQRLSTLSAKEANMRDRDTKFQVSPPWLNFRSDVEKAINNLVVSHANKFRIRGQLHEETVYGYDKGKNVYLIRKNLTDLTTLKQINKIHDNKVREKVITYLKSYNDDFKAAWENLKKEPYPLLNENGNKIKKVRLRENMNPKGMITIEKNGTRKIFSSGNNHHVEIFVNSNTGERQWKVINQFEASKRSQLKQPIIFKNYEDLPENEGWKFDCYYAVNDTFQFITGEQPQYFRVQKISLDDITLQPHTYSLSDYKSGLTRAIKSPKGTQGWKKVNLDILGKVR